LCFSVSRARSGNGFEISLSGYGHHDRCADVPVCGAAHWMREPHVFKEEVKIAAPQVVVAAPDVAALVRVSMILQKRVAELRHSWWMRVRGWTRRGKRCRSFVQCREAEELSQRLKSKQHLRH